MPTEWTILTEANAAWGVGLARSTRSAGKPRTWGRREAEQQPCRGHIPALRGRPRMSTKLARIAEKAKADRKLRFTSLAHLLTPEFLLERWGNR